MPSNFNWIGLLNMKNINRFVKRNPQVPSDFDALAYLELNPDVVSGGFIGEAGALRHWLNHGMHEGRQYKKQQHVEQQHKNKNNITVQKNLLKPKLISYYADFQPGDYYKNFAIALIDKCNQFGIDFDIVEKSSKGGYSTNCLMKPEFILEKMIEYKRDILWMDCDTDFREPFAEFNYLTQDIGLATHSGDMDGIKASPLLLNYTEGAFRIVREWIVHNNSALRKRITELDHDALKHYVLEKLKGKYTAFLLSRNWYDFVNGRYIYNGNSAIFEKKQVHIEVQAMTNEQRWNISSDVKTFMLDVKIEGVEGVEIAYNSLMNFSNHSRIKIYLPESSKDILGPFVGKIKAESGGEVHYGPVTTGHNEIKIEVKNTLEKDWDKHYGN